ncbi:hypothetical protein [Streptomyces sp. NPDC048155]|uniref:hypothetical protein n=1 Tax=Streptomyces sp. NPDC048155 TaxID=3154818 RepID=UPI00340388D8
MPDGSEGADRPGAGGPGADAKDAGATTDPGRTAEAREAADAGAGGAAPAALDLPGTAGALERYRASARRWFGGGAAGVCSAVFLAVSVGGWSVIPTLGGLGGALLVGGAVVGRRARRMRRALGAGPWVAHASVALQRGSSGAVVVLGGPGQGELLPLAPSTAQWRFHLLNGPGGVLWWCGDPRRGGVLAPPGGTELIWAKPVRDRRARTIAARPEAGGLHTRPAPRQPQIAPGDTTGAGAGAGARARAGAGAFGGVVRHGVRGRGTRGGRPSSYPLPDRPWVRGGRPGAGPGAELDGGPDGELDSGPDGGPGSGPDSRAVTESAPPRADSTHLTYAAFAAVAERQAWLRGPDPVRPRAAGPVRVGQEVTWWRVPMLRYVAGTAGTSWALGYAGVIAGLCWVVDAGAVPDFFRGLAVLSGLLGLYGAWRMFRSGIPLARRLARAAVAPEPRTRRYALLCDADNASAAPLLVLFPEKTAGKGTDGGTAGGADGDAAPEGLLRLLPPGPDKCPWAGLPAPTGTAELRCRPDGPPLAVAWIEGRPYWPQDVYTDIDPSDPRALDALSDLVPGPV